MLSVVNGIIGRDKVLGDLACESLHCAESGMFLSALSCLFILVEQGVKLAVDRTDGNFYELSVEAKDKGFLTEQEFNLIDRLRECRNKLFHESHYSWTMEKDGRLYPFSEDETRKLIYKEFSTPCMEVVLELLKLQEVDS